MGEGAVPEDLPAGFVPPASMKDYLVKDSKIKLRVRPNAWFKADHTKTIVIDKKICFTGGMNIGREYRYNWHDLMIELQGDVIGEITREFTHAWEHASKLGDVAYLKSMLTPSQENNTQEGYPIRLLYTRADNPQIYPLSWRRSALLKSTFTLTTRIFQIMRFCMSLSAPVDGEWMCGSYCRSAGTIRS
jgi:phosphatidylserine/phosphatidylglycerophosphate/cardiolipin synthase-like enzyme